MVSIGECIVCGVKTDQSCQPCLRAGNKSILFCSREHQKLVWFAHKRVCGKRGNPFRFPRLSESEIERYGELSTVTVPGHHEESWLDISSKECGWTGSIEKRKALFMVSTSR